MGSQTSIEWTCGKDGSPGASWNPIRARNRATGAIGWFCAHESEGCRNCYAEALNRRLGTGVDFNAQNLAQVELLLDEKMLMQPLHWHKPRKIFVCSMTDLFASFVPDEWIDRIFAVMALCPQHTFIVLTKRAERMRDYMTAPLVGPGASRVTRINEHGGERPMTDVDWRMRDAVNGILSAIPGRTLNNICADLDRLWPGDGFYRRWPLPNAWLGVSIEDQATADARVLLLLDTPAAVRFVSAEPLLASLDVIGGRRFVGPEIEAGFDAYADPSGFGPTNPPPLDWVIVGGESGPRARPLNIEWVRGIIAQCKAAGVACFVKQLGAMPIIEDVLPFGADWPGGTRFGNRIGIKSFNGRCVLLRDPKGGDWREWPCDLRVRQYPEDMLA